MKKSIYMLATLSCVLCLGSCQDVLQDSMNNVNASESESELTLNLSVAPVCQFGGTKALDPSVSVNEGLDPGYMVRDIWFVEFNDKGLRVGVPQYIENPDFTQIMHLVQPQESGLEYTLVAVANTHNSGWAENYSDYMQLLDKLKSLSVPITSVDQLYNDAYVDWDGNSYDADLLYSAVVKIDNTTSSLDLHLTRNVAKFTLNLSNEADDVYIETARVRNVQGNLYFADAANAEEAAPFPLTRDVDIIDFAADIVDMHNGDSRTMTFYLPRNIRGYGSSTSSAGKNADVNDNCTYLELVGEEISTGTPLRYKFYLGNDMVSNFDIVPNYHYILPVRISGKGDPMSDSRVEIFDRVVCGDANSHMIHPRSSTAQTLYSFPVADRINAFWRSSDGKPYINEYETKYHVTDDFEWIAEVIWQDSPERIIYFCNEDGSLAEGTGNNFIGHGNDLINVKTVAGALGNVLVGVRRNGADVVDEGYLWSWHLWITDYEPEYYEPWTNNIYSYGVTNGKVFRYNDYNGCWGSHYKNKYIMDRDLGSWYCSHDRTVAENMGNMYQYGRKDPFFHHKDVYDINGQPISFAGATQSYVPFPINSAGPTWFYVAVKHPTTMFLTTSEQDGWASKDNNYYDNPFYNPTWNPIGDSYSKSFFDPCPDGWRIPNMDVFGIFSSSKYYNGQYLYQVKNYSDVGVDVYVGGIHEGESTFLPFSGEIYYYGYSSGGHYMWGSTSHRYSYWYTTYGDYSSSYEREKSNSYAYSVRCIQE